MVNPLRGSGIASGIDARWAGSVKQREPPLTAPGAGLMVRQ